ncbi:MAG TPA: DNA gyrase subunit B, partial [Acidobacteriaceae bacterium]
MVIRYGENGAQKHLEGGALTKFMGQLNDYLAFFEKADKRIRNEEVTSLLAKLELVRRTDFESADGKAPAKLAQLHKALLGMRKTYQFKDVGEPALDEEHQTWSVSFTDAEGAVRRVDWALASAPEYRQMMAKHAQIKDELEPPFFIEYAAKGKAATAEESVEEAVADDGSDTATGEALTAKAVRKAPRNPLEPVEKKTARDLFEYVIEQGRRDYQVQRYKGLGEMTAPQLWETTMDPERRTLLSVKLEDLAATEEIFTTLMGEDVEARRKFIEDNALDVKNLDI